MSPAYFPLYRKPENGHDRERKLHIPVHIQNEVFFHSVCEFYHIIKTPGYGLRLVFLVYNCKVVLKYGIGINQYLIIPKTEELLFLRSVCLAEEARP